MEFFCSIVSVIAIIATFISHYYKEIIHVITIQSYLFCWFCYCGCFLDKKKANDIYREIYPVLVKAITQQGRNSPDAIRLLNVLGGLPSIGLKRRNFNRRYISNENGWRDLPSDPNTIPYGFWH